METLLLIVAIIAYHYPAGLYRDTQRRYTNMRENSNLLSYGPEHDIWGFTLYSFPALHSCLVGIIIPILCLIQLDINWFLAIIINIPIYIFVGPTLAFISTPHMRVHTNRSLIFLTIISFILAVALHVSAFVIYN
jgi:hypothetical protein